MKFTINNNLRLLTCPLLLAGAVCCSSGNDGDTPAPGPGPDPSPVTGDVLAYVTSADGNRLFTEEGLDYSKVSMSPYRVTIDPSTTYQTVDGFGPAITGATCYNLLQMSQADRTAILRKCFDPETGAGFSFIRVHIGGSDFSMDEYTCCDREGIEFFAIPAVEKDGIFPVLKEILEIKPPSQADGIILGEKNGSVVCLPKDTRLNRHIAVFGASGTRKSRGVIRPALFTILKRGESAVITDPKAELYNDTAELFRKNGYEVKVFNLVDPRHGDSWNCMSDLNGDTLLAQVLTNVIISNTSEGKGDHFWDNGEANLLKALVLYIDLDRSRSPETKNLAAAYQLLTQNSERQLTALFEKLPLDHPARAPFNLFSQASDTVRSGIVLGLGTRLQVLQNEAVRDIISRSDIDLTAPGKRKCAYFVILSDQDATMAFLSSLFFSFLFIKLVRYADSTPELRCKVPVNLIFDEFNNVGKLGGAADGSDFARTLSVIRSRAIYVMLAVQSLGQLQNRYPNNLWAEIVGNLDVQLMLGCTDEVSAEYFSARSGDMSVEINSTMTVRKTIAVAQVIPQYRQTEGQGRRRLLTPDEVLRIPNEELLVVIRGHNVLKLKKFDYADHPLAKELTPVSILDYTPPHAAAPFLQTETTLPRAASEERPHTSSTPSKRRTLYSSAKPPSEF